MDTTQPGGVATALGQLPAAPASRARYHGVKQASLLFPAAASMTGGISGIINYAPRKRSPPGLPAVSGGAT
jgi:hypothetical protein